VLNVVDFGAFVDIGLKDSGLVHISQMANRFIKSPYEVVSVSDVVTVWVMNVDAQRHRVSLTMIRPGTERKPHERRAPPPPRRDGRPGEARPGRGEGPPPAGPPKHQRRGGGPRRGGGRPQGRPRPHPAPAASAPSGETRAAAGPPSKAPPPPPPPRRRRREPPKPKLTQ